MKKGSLFEMNDLRNVFRIENIGFYQNSNALSYSNKFASVDAYSLEFIGPIHFNVLLHNFGNFALDYIDTERLVYSKMRLLSLFAPTYSFVTFGQTIMIFSYKIEFVGRRKRIILLDLERAENFEKTFLINPRILVFNKVDHR